MKKIFAFVFLITPVLFCQSIKFIGEPEIFIPDIICTGVSEVKITFSPDGKTVLWGAINRSEGIGGCDIWMASNEGNGWKNPRPVSFNSTDNDFDPCFSPDGKIVFFFSNRPGGYGKDDLYSVNYNSENNSFGVPVNMGAGFNTPGDEWGPTVSSDGSKFLFCTDSLNGKGKHDIYLCHSTDKGWSTPEPLTILNSDKDDFDPVFLLDNKTILFTREINDEETLLYISYLSENGYTAPEPLNERVNINGTWNFGSSINFTDTSYIYYSTYIKEKSKGKLDIYRIKYSL